MIISRKKMIAVAAAVACGAPMIAQAQTNVTVYGKLYPQINNIDVKGATAPGTTVSSLSRVGSAADRADRDVTAMESNNTRIGFKGSENLGSGLKAVFQLETAFGIDDGRLGSANTLFSRNTFVGLGGGFGLVKLGKMDTVYKDLGDTLSFLGISSGNFVSNSNILSKPGTGDTSAASFHRRLNNTIMYESPEVAGFQGLVGYTFGESTEGFRNGSVVSTGVKYEAGPLYAALAHERHDNLYGGSRSSVSGVRNFRSPGGGAPAAPVPGTNSEDTATRLTVQYKFTKATRVEANIARLEYEEQGGITGRFASHRFNTWSIGAAHRLGPTTLQASYAQANEGSCSLVGVACSTAGLGSKQLNLGASYALSKRTALFAIASYLRNDESAVRNNTDGDDLAAGQDTRQVALGITHNF